MPAELQQLGPGTGSTPISTPGFEDLFRGAELDIKGRMADYVPLFAGAGDVLDVGCGRGEFLELLRDAGIARAASTSTTRWSSAAAPRASTSPRGDALSYLRALPPGALGGLVADAGGRAPPARLPAAFLTAAPTRCGPAASGARDHQPGLLERLLR